MRELASRFKRLHDVELILLNLKLLIGIGAVC